MAVKIPLQGGREQVAADRLMQALDNRITGEPKPTKLQVAMVLHGLADFTAQMHMTQYDRLDHHGSNAGKETNFYPTETSIGRWFHAVGHDLEDQVMMEDRNNERTS